MTRKTLTLALMALVLLGFAGEEAAAWGPRAQRAIATTSLQLLRRNFPQESESTASKYEADVVRGALDGYQWIGGDLAVSNPVDASRAVEAQIRLLRSIRQFGIGSYFSYRLGVLSSLVSDLVLPYALDTSAPARSISDQIRADIDAHVAEYRVKPDRKKPVYVRDPLSYFARKRQFFSDARTIIAADYESAKGYNGYLEQAGPAAFTNAVESVVDVWFSVLTDKAPGGEQKPSPQAQTWYLVNEIEYLLVSKQNRYEADKTYEYFKRVNPGIMETYERVGDLYYQSGHTDRGVEEWQKALELPSPIRTRVLEKLTNHYLRTGEEFLVDAEDPEQAEQALSQALHAFEQALKYDRDNQEAADKLTETRQTIKMREERRQFAINIIASGEKIMQDAEAAAKAGNAEQAIALYQRAESVLETVDEEFPAQQKAARDNTNTITNQIRDLINTLLREADSAIANGDQALEQRKFDMAADYYNQVKRIVGPIPTDESATYGQRKQELIEKAEAKLAEVETERKRFEEMQRQQPQQPEAPGGGTGFGPPQGFGGPMGGGEGGG